MYVLGISAYYHDSAAALIKDGEIVAAAQEERFTRKKHDSSFPKNAIEYCLTYEGIQLDDIDSIAFYDKPFLKFERLLETYLATAPKGFLSFSKSLPIWIKEKLFQKDLLVQSLERDFNSKNIRQRLLFGEHHLSHAASAFYPSPYDEALILTLDGVGEWATTSVAIGSKSSIEIKKEIHFPHSLGLLYSAFTYHSGFKVNSGEYKLMGLAPYGTPRFKDLILEHLIDIKDDGSFRLNMNYFAFCTEMKMTNSKFDQLFGEKARRPETPITQFQMDMAASVQSVTEMIVEKIACSQLKEFGQKNLCLAGGVALNCVANGKLLKNKVVENLWIQPAAGDAGGALGVALLAYHSYHQKPRITQKSDCMKGSYLGPSYKSKDIVSALDNLGAVYKEETEEEMYKFVSKSLSEGMAVGWFQGRMEFGPRALGARSIVADPRNENMQKNLNLKIKFRESFRPFAPSVLKEESHKWFQLEKSSPYMLIVADLDKSIRTSYEKQEGLFGISKLNLKRSKIPAVTHVDHSARVQTVDKATNPKFHKLLSHFNELTDCPVLVNTSFNIRGEPIVCTPEDAFRCFMGTNLDLLVIDNFLIMKTHQNSQLTNDYTRNVELD